MFNNVVHVPNEHVDLYTTAGFLVVRPSEVGGHTDMAALMPEQHDFSVSCADSRPFIAPKQICRPLSRHLGSPIEHTLRSRGLTTDVQTSASLARMRALLFAYTLHKCERIFLKIGARRFALRVFTRMGEEQLATYIDMLLRIRHSTFLAANVTNFTLQHFTDMEVPYNVDAWIDCTNDTVFTFDKNYASTLRQQLERRDV